MQETKDLPQESPRGLKTQRLQMFQEATIEPTPSEVIEQQASLQVEEGKQRVQDYEFPDQNSQVKFLKTVQYVGECALKARGSSFFVIASKKAFKDRA